MIGSISSWSVKLQIIVVLVAVGGFVANAEPTGKLRVEGHVFSATTLRPLPGVMIELWSFYPEHPLFTAAFPNQTDEGGFYQFDSDFASVDEDGNDRATAYAFAFICRYQGQRKVQIVPFYRSLVPMQVYTRNVYMQVPASVGACDADVGN